MPKKRPAPKPEKPAAPPAAKPAAQARAAVGTVTLWGEITEEDTTHIHFAVANHGDAKNLGLCGVHVFAKRQLFSQGRVDGFDYIRVSFNLASFKATRSQPCD